MPLQACHWLVVFLAPESHFSSQAKRQLIFFMCLLSLFLRFFLSDLSTAGRSLFARRPVCLSFVWKLSVIQLSRVHVSQCEVGVNFD